MGPFAPAVPPHGRIGLFTGPATGWSASAELR